MFKSPITTASKFHRDEKGGVAILFGLTAVVVTMAVGLAVDIGRSVSSKTKISQAADAAALAAAKGLRLEGLSDAQAIALAQKVFAENMRQGSGNWTTIESVDVTIDRNTSMATVDVKSYVPTTFAGITGIDKLNSLGTATALFESRDIEVSIQLDLTGSMCIPSCSKLDDLKEATKDLVDILIPSSPTAQKVRVAFAPFSAGVNVGSYIRDVNGDRASVNNCAYERKTATNAKTDAAPEGDDAYKIKADLSGMVQPCPKAEIVPLTDKREVLKTAVDGYKATSSTAGQLGAAWAWNLISPNWYKIWPADSTPVEYSNKKTDKIVILMTDGVYNTIGGVNFGDTSSQAVAASKLSVDICNNMKAAGDPEDAGVKVYTVGFDLDSIPDATARARATNTLKACGGRKGAYDPDDYFFKADNGKELRDAFRAIAQDIMQLRLTN